MTHEQNRRMETCFPRVLLSPGIQWLIDTQSFRVSVLSGHPVILPNRVRTASHHGPAMGLNWASMFNRPRICVRHTLHEGQFLLWEFLMR
jgi:hypothetical protein